MLVLTGFTGKVDTAGLTEFVTRSFDVGARVWVQDDVYRGEVTRASSMNRYAYVEGAPETYVDVGTAVGLPDRLTSYFQAAIAAVL